MKIEFIPSDEYVEMIVQPPKPAKEYIPNWYKEHKNINQFDDALFSENGEMLKTIKECMPFFDAFSTGYIQETWTDIYINYTNGKPSYSYPSGPNIIELRESANVSVSNEYNNDEFVWTTPWLPKLPKGYSVIVTHPFNHFGPFQTLTGIIDCDTFYHTPFGRVPFYVKKGFTGIIPAGTPMFQLIPFKRDSWNSELIAYDEKKQVARNSIIRKNFIGSYKKMFWNKKEYN
jgi:hypothetical protein